MRRRSVLTGCSTVLAGLLAGCGGGGGGGGGDGESGGETSASAPESTPTEQEVSLEGGSSNDGSSAATPTEAPTATVEPTDAPATATPTPTRSGNVHQTGDRFTVGEGDNAITYRIIEFHRTAELGNRASRATADGTFLIVTLEITNPQDGRVTLPREDFRARSDRTWHQMHRDGTEKIAIDDRIDERSLWNQAVQSGGSMVGAVAFDTDPNSSYRLWLTPAGGPDTPEHFVPVGDISSVQEL